MALNKFMHPRNIYKKPPDFKHLAMKSPDFRKHIIHNLTGKVSIDFKNAEALRSLTVTLLKVDFGLDVELPLDRLIPTLPLRLNYIHWLEDIVHQSGKENIRGIDIGTGASCVYPLLGSKLNNWQFLATEVDMENLVYARKNVIKNGLDEMITVKHVPPDTVLQSVCGEFETYDFCMCNPPFFADHMEAQALFSRNDRPEPSSANTASCVEQIAEGGEKAFVKKMISESLELKDKVRVFTSMLGKKASVAPLKEELKKLKIPKFSSVEFCQGKTMRWGLAWTFDDTVQFPKSSFQHKKKERPPLVFVIPKTGLPGEYNLEAVTSYIQGELNNLKIDYEERKSTEYLLSLTLSASDNTWSNQRRKRRARERNKSVQQSNQSAETVVDSPALHDPVDSRSLETRAGGDNLLRGDNPIKGDNSSEGIISVSAEDTVAGIEAEKSSHEDKFDNKNIDHCGEKQAKRMADEQLLSEECKRNKMDDSEVGLTCGKEQDSGCIVDEEDDDEDITGNRKDENIFTSMLSKETENKKASGGLECEKGNCDATDDKAENSYLLKCSLTLRQCEENIQMEMVWINGKNLEVMHQVMQYFKNKLNPSHT